ncbi:MAG: diacylglycerol kinase family protein [Candidatus Pacebacteria bacterium]|nr:diacylglycerol kinase family protein [Candidatus Paceibacterota bacterium]
MIKIKRLVRSFRHAGNGLKYAMREPNFTIEITIAAGAIFLAAFFCIERWEWAALISVTLLVLMLEIINTVCERMIDIMVPRSHPYAKDVKDMMAGAVLLACFGSVAVGFIIFFPYFAAILNII